ncbi:KxYKxGKxW signal peptide domain-containing protein, partial [Enterococcus faecium]
MEVKKRFKMYKKGKTWVIAPILFIGVASFTVNNEVAKASEQPVTNATVAESTDGNNTVVDNGSSNTSIAEEAPNISEDK